MRNSILSLYNNKSTQPLIATSIFITAAIMKSTSQNRIAQDGKYVAVGYLGVSNSINLEVRSIQLISAM
jgi:hypothetical protein